MHVPCYRVLRRGMRSNDGVSYRHYILPFISMTNGSSELRINHAFRLVSTERRGSA